MITVEDMTFYSGKCQLNISAKKNTRIDINLPRYLYQNTSYRLTDADIHLYSARRTRGLPKRDRRQAVDHNIFIIIIIIFFFCECLKPYNLCGCSRRIRANNIPIIPTAAN